MEKPRKLVTFCVLALVLGGVGVVNSISGLSQWTAGNYSGPQATRYQDDKFLEMQQRMTSEMAEVMAPFKPYYIPILIGHLVLSVALIVSGFKALAIREIGLKLLPIILWLKAPLDIASAAINGFIGHKMAGIVSNNLARIADSNPPQGAPDLKSWITGLSQFGAYAALVFGVLWLVAKIVFYFLATKYFRQPETARLFTGSKGLSVPPPLPPADKVWD